MSDLFNLSGDTAVVTGSSRGIGLAIADALLAQGANVVINGMDADQIDETVAALSDKYLADREGGRRVAGLPADVSHSQDVSDLFALTLSTFGRVDHVVCNAGIDNIKPAVDYSVEEWDQILTVNLRGTFLPAQEAARHWIETGQAGSITMTSSIAGSVGIPTLAPYAASKGGVNQLVRTLAVEWAAHRIRVNGVAPGYVANIMNNVTAHDDPESDRRIATFTPLARRASVEEVAGPYAFLASPAARYVTGAILAVDGGYTAH